MRVFGVCKMSRLVGIVLAVLLVVGLSVGTAIPSARASGTVRKLPVYSVEDSAKIAITFDASWGAERTKGIVDILVSNNVRATFFLTGIWIDAYPDETKYIAEKGMEIGNHSQNHYSMSKMSADAIRNEIELVNTKVAALTNGTPVVFRAPFGDYSNTLVDAVESMDMRCIQWDVDSLDWKGLSAKVLIERVVGKTKGGSIILCHNNSEHILEALPTILETLGKQYTFVTVSELLSGKTGKIDHTGKLHEMP